MPVAGQKCVTHMQTTTDSKKNARIAHHATLFTFSFEHNSIRPQAAVTPIAYSVDNINNNYDNNNHHSNTATAEANKPHTHNAMATLEDKSLWETTPEEEVLGADILKANTEEIVNRTRLLDNDIKVSTYSIHLE